MRRNRLGRREKRAFVLAYHRVGRVTTDPQLLCVTPEHFTEHLELITKRYEPARLDELVAATRPDRAVAVTFDDGYADTLLAAKPLLERASVHATVFGGHRNGARSEEHTSELQSHSDLVCRLLLEKKKTTQM